MQIDISNTASSGSAVAKNRVRFRKPTKEDGAAVWRLIGDLDALDDNSMYCNLLQCSHFSETCVIAEQGDEVVGWVSAYLPPEKANTLFVWQVAVAPEMRGRGVAKSLLRTLLKRDACDDVSHLESTITRDNDASWGLFRSFADELDGDLSEKPHFRREDHFDGEHATEYLVRIGPIATEDVARAA